MTKVSISRYFISILLVMISLISLAQHNWETGEISIKSKAYTIKVDNDKWVIFNRINDDPRLELELGYGIETGRVEVLIESAQEFISIIRDAFPSEKLEFMAKEEKQFSLGIAVDENGIPFNVRFHLKPNTLITPEELIFIESEIIKRVRYRIRREKPYGQPCIYTSGGVVKFQDILNGEIPGLKRSEQQGKEKPEWER